jgi:hypothetical protein
MQKHLAFSFSSSGEIISGKAKGCAHARANEQSQRDQQKSDS